MDPDSLSKPFQLKEQKLPHEVIVMFLQLLSHFLLVQQKEVTLAAVVAGMSKREESDAPDNISEPSLESQMKKNRPNKQVCTLCSH
jgi:hypothetical protein